MTKEYDDFDDFDLEICGETFLTDKEEEKEVKEEDKEEKEWRECLERMNEHTKTSWIAIPEIGEDDKLRLKIYTLKEATGKQFIEWLYYVWPASKKLEYGVDEETFNKYDNREYVYKSVLVNPNVLSFTNSF